MYDYNITKIYKKSILFIYLFIYLTNLNQL